MKKILFLLVIGLLVTGGLGYYIFQNSVGSKASEQLKCIEGAKCRVNFQCGGGFCGKGTCRCNLLITEKPVVTPTPYCLPGDPMCPLFTPAPTIGVSSYPTPYPTYVPPTVYSTPLPTKPPFPVTQYPTLQPTYYVTPTQPPLSCGQCGYKDDPSNACLANCGSFAMCTSVTKVSCGGNPNCFKAACN